MLWLGNQVSLGSMLAAVGITLTGTLLAFTGIASADTMNHHHDFAQWQHRSVDSDLFTFVTRPDLKPPKFKIALNKHDRTAPGYIFVAPYDCLECSNVPTTAYATQQIGPLIYSQDGELVWSGIDLFPNTKVFNFRSVTINGGHYLSLVAPPDTDWQPYPSGFAMVLNASYQPTFSMTTEELGQRIDMHEFHILDDGQTALIGVTSDRVARKSDKVQWQGQIRDCAFTEINLRTRKRSFDWTASDHVPFSETTNPAPKSAMENESWDWFQLNSMDKDKFGNYLISSRMTNTIYYVAPDGKVIWRLGGLQSSFSQDFTFSRQHHARVRDQNDVNMVISFFDNAADDTGKGRETSGISSLLVVGLDLVNWVATLYHRHERPDGGLTRTSSGNIQFLPNGGVFGGWGENGYMTEYINRGGEKLYEASFASKRFSNYRAYKMEFVGQPLTKPIVKGFVSTNALEQLRTAIYVSWNGATEVMTWRFFAHVSQRQKGVASNIEIGRVPKTGFETSFVAMGYHPVIFAEALDAFGNSLANSTLDVTEIPAGFHTSGSPMYTGGLEGQSKLRYGWDIAMRTLVAFLAGLVVANVWARYRSGKNHVGWKSGAHWAPKRKK